MGEPTLETGIETKKAGFSQNSFPFIDIALCRITEDYVPRKSAKVR